MAMRPLPRFARKIAVVGDERLARLFQRRLDHGMAPAFDF